MLGKNKLGPGKKLLFASIPLLLLLLTLELLARALPHRDQGRTRGDFVMPDPDPQIMWRLRPYKDGPAKTNELGLRDTPFRDDADRKILLLGDSVSWADGIMDTRAAYPYLLERLLERAMPGKTMEVINAGVPGYSTFQQAAYFAKRGVKLEPDLVVLQFCLNDVIERYRTLAQYGGDNVHQGIDTRQVVRGVTGTIIRHSRAGEYFVRFLQQRSRGREAYDVAGLASDRLSPQLQSAWELVFSELDTIVNTAREHDVPLMLVIAPYRFQLEDAENLRQPQDALLAYARRHKLPVFDLLPGFAEQRGKAELFNDDNHFSLAGHQLAALLLRQPVTDMLEQGNKAPAGG